jgi:hypothetical protein
MHATLEAIGFEVPFAPTSCVHLSFDDIIGAPFNIKSKMV